MEFLKALIIWVLMSRYCIKHILGKAQYKTWTISFVVYDAFRGYKFSKTEQQMVKIIMLFSYISGEILWVVRIHSLQYKLCAM
jgi:hypothetical protein